jgi:hypothetical protein
MQKKKENFILTLALNKISGKYCKIGKSNIVLPISGKDVNVFSNINTAICRA